MIIKYDLEIGKFKAWSGAVSTLERIINEGKEADFESLLDELFPDGLTETVLNDILWFDADWVYEALGMECDDEC